MTRLDTSSSGYKKICSHILLTLCRIAVSRRLLFYILPPLWTWYTDIITACPCNILQSCWQLFEAIFQGCFLMECFPLWSENGLQKGNFWRHFLKTPKHTAKWAAFTNRIHVKLMAHTGFFLYLYLKWRYTACKTTCFTFIVDFSAVHCVYIAAQ